MGSAVRKRPELVLATAGAALRTSAEASGEGPVSVDVDVSELVIDETPLPVRRGDVLAGKYRVEGVLGMGGVGVVVAARHLQLDERVAIKFLLPEALSNPEAVARFDREARAAVKIKSEHVAHVIDVGRLDNGAPYMVMEHLEGHDLSSLVAQQGPLPFAQAAEFVLQACEAIAEAHALGIVHRDLKPANLFCVRRADGLLAVKVLDFGISKVTGLGGSLDLAMTQTTTIMGSPLYMSPEQMHASHDVDARTDIWSLGIILYELVTAKMPFASEGLADLVLEIAMGEVPSLRALRPEVPEGFEQVVLRCLQKSRDDRFLNVGELAAALAEFAPERAVASVERVERVIRTASLSSPSLLLPPRADGVSRPHTPASWNRTGRRTQPRAGGHRTLSSVVSLLLLVLSVGAVALVALKRPLGIGTSGISAIAHQAPAVAPPSEAATPPQHLAPLPPDTVVPAPAAAPEPSHSAEPATTVAQHPVVVSAPLRPPPRPVLVSREVPRAPLAESDPEPVSKVEPSPAPAPVPRAAPVTAPPAPRAAAPDCDPPYVIDSAARRQYKPECL